MGLLRHCWLLTAGVVEQLTASAFSSDRTAWALPVRSAWTYYPAGYLDSAPPAVP